MQANQTPHSLPATRTRVYSASTDTINGHSAHNTPKQRPPHRFQPLTASLHSRPLRVTPALRVHQHWTASSGSRRRIWLAAPTSDEKRPAESVLSLLPFRQSERVSRLSRALPLPAFLIFCSAQNLTSFRHPRSVLRLGDSYLGMNSQRLSALGSSSMARIEALAYRLLTYLM